MGYNVKTDTVYAGEWTSARKQFQFGSARVPRVAFRRLAETDFSWCAGQRLTPSDGKVRDGETQSPGTRDACATLRNTLALVMERD